MPRRIFTCWCLTCQNTYDHEFEYHLGWWRGTTDIICPHCKAIGGKSFEFMDEDALYDWLSQCRADEAKAQGKPAPAPLKRLKVVFVDHQVKTVFA